MDSAFVKFKTTPKISKISIQQKGVVYSIPVDCVFQRTNDHQNEHRVKRTRREAVATAHSRFDIKLQYVDSVFSGPLPNDKRLIGKYNRIGSFFG